MNKCRLRGPFPTTAGPLSAKSTVSRTYSLTVEQPNEQPKLVYGPLSDLSSTVVGFFSPRPRSVSLEAGTWRESETAINVCANGERNRCLTFSLTKAASCRGTSIMNEHPRPPFPRQQQPMPGETNAMRPKPDHGETSYRGSGKLAGKRAVITGADSGIGRAVAIAFAREGADVLISYLNEHDDAKETQRLVEEAGRKAALLAGDIQSAAHCRKIIETASEKLGGIDILVNNAAHQATFKSIEDISDDEWELTFRVNIHAMFYLSKAAVPHMKPGSAIINTASINADTPNPTLLAYATTKGAIQNFTAGLAQLLAGKGIRANAVAPGPIWTPLIPSTMPKEAVENFGKQVPMKRPGQPAELATAYVMLADPLSSYVSGATIAVTGGKPIL
jgi:NAD(P)-dependent dehydrogenase (short-subunit alcohol dehydrogenase family)